MVDGTFRRVPARSTAVDFERPLGIHSEVSTTPHIATKVVSAGLNAVGGIARPVLGHLDHGGPHERIGPPFTDKGADRCKKRRWPGTSGIPARVSGIPANRQRHARLCCRLARW
jgi:hypothetical protein